MCYLCSHEIIEISSDSSDSDEIDTFSSSELDSSDSEDTEEFIGECHNKTWILRISAYIRKRSGGMVIQFELSLYKIV